MPGDDSGERSEQPTARRREEARKEGQIPKSQDLTAAAGLLAAVLLLQAFGPGMQDNLVAFLREHLNLRDVNTADPNAWAYHTFTTLLRMLGPFLGLLFVLTLVGTISQTGVSLFPKKIAPNIENLSWKRGLKKVFSVDALARTGLGVLKMVIVAWVAYDAIVAGIDRVILTGALHTTGLFGVSIELIHGLALRLALVLLILGLLDYFYQRARIGRQLKMTKQEVKDELKQMEGDPLLKARRRQAQAKLAMQRINAEVPRADVVVTNPTEYAVALRYDEESMTAPRVTAKGRDYLAGRIRELANRHRVPIVQRPPLARALYAAVEPGEEVPQAYYRAVAEVLAYVYSLPGRAAAG